MSEYNDIDAKRLGYFAGSIVAAAVVVTAIYCGLYGLKKWTGSMQQGANLMMVAAPAPYQGSVRTGAAGQFICPTHGAVGLPVVDASGVPRCPLCNGAMSFNGPQAGAQAGPVGLAAFAGGGG
ncbi:MAG: hypothetical protein ABSH41_13375 [Syntrophobacteraceae bacterium]